MYININGSFAGAGVILVSVVEVVLPQLVNSRLNISGTSLAEMLCCGYSGAAACETGKSEQYAKCGIPEYWLINPEQQVVTVLELEAEKYIEVGTFRGDERINSRILQNFKVTAGQLFARTIPPG